MRKTTIALMTTSVALLVACNQPNITGASDAKSIAHYSSHPEEAMSIAEKCMAFEKGEFSTMTLSKQAAWKETTDGINCGNARHAAVLLDMQARQKRLSDSANRYK